MARRCYGSGAPGRKFFDDIAATPDLPSPSKGPRGEPGTHSSSSAGEANQKTTWFRSIRTPVMLLKAKASSMMASMRTFPLPLSSVVKSPIYSTAPKGGTGISVRKTAKVVFGRRSSARNTSESTPSLSSLGKTVTCASACGRQAAIASEAGTKSNSNLAAWAAARLNMSVRPRVAIASKSECLARDADLRVEVSNRDIVPRGLVIELFLDCIVLVSMEVELFMVH